jgi:hypothetical protein
MRAAHNSAFTPVAVLGLASTVLSACAPAPAAVAPANAAIVSVEWSYIRLTSLDGVEPPRPRQHGCQDVRANRCGTYALSPGAHTFEISSARAERSGGSVTSLEMRVARISVELAAGHRYLVLRGYVYDTTASRCWYEDAGPIECRPPGAV